MSVVGPGQFVWGAGGPVWQPAPAPNPLAGYPPGSYIVTQPPGQVGGGSATIYDPTGKPIGGWSESGFNLAAPGASSTTQGGPAGAPNQTPVKVGPGAYGKAGGGSYGYGAPAAPMAGAAPTAPSLGMAPQAFTPGLAPQALTFNQSLPIARPPQAGPPPPALSRVMNTPAINPLHAAIQRQAAPAAGMQAASPADWMRARARMAGYPLP